MALAWIGLAKKAFDKVKAGESNALNMAENAASGDTEVLSYLRKPEKNKADQKAEDWTNSLLKNPMAIGQDTNSLVSWVSGLFSGGQ